MKKSGVLFGFSGVFIVAFLLQINFLEKTAKKSDLQFKNEPFFLQNNTAWADSVLTTLSLDQKIAQFFMVAAWSSDEKNNKSTIEKWIKENGIGGIIFFQGDSNRQRQLTDYYQSISQVPLLIGMDAEWGPAMRLSDAERYPYQLTMGATNDEKLIHDAAYWIGRECLDLGVHINFAPVVDVNVNPRNPVIGYRSFGENPRDVARFALAFTQGMENAGVMACVKHFPGHGDTDKDSHHELPTVNHTEKQFRAIDFVPFERTIKGGVSSVMVAHLNVPSLDSSGTPSSLSKKVIKNWLQDSLGFKGLVISDALNMKGVSDQYGKIEVVLKAFEAGNDILLFPEAVEDAINAIKKAVINGRISENDINNRCLKILQAKHWAINQMKNSEPLTQRNKVQIELLKRSIVKSAITIVRNEQSILPLTDMSKSTAIVLAGRDLGLIENRLLDYISADVFYFQTGIEPLDVLDRIGKYERIIHVFVAETNRPVINYGFPEGWDLYIKNIDKTKENIGLFLGNPYALNESITTSSFDGVVIAYENSRFTQDLTPQALVGAISVKGVLPVTLNQSMKRGQFFETVGGSRLQFTIPEELGIDRNAFVRIDSLALAGIQKGAYPGCQVVVAQHGKVIYRKNFGAHTYDNSVPVSDRSVYDLASITKIAASTLTLMDLAGKGLFHLDSTLGSYLPEIVKGTTYEHLKMRDILTHQAGLTPWIPFYTKTLLSGQWRKEIYSTESKQGYTMQVAENLYILDSYQDSIFARILATPLKKGQGYKYSDVGYYFMKEIIRKQTGMTLDEYTRKQFYEPMGLNSMRYLPLTKFPKQFISPTEDDKLFRKQLIHGYVHDQGAAMTGGVGGHAGLFSNAIDLASLMQMMLNQGEYGGKHYLNAKVVKEFTKCQYCSTNRRAIGFDKPVRSLSGGPTCELVSLDSYGHTGFTGTMAWVDPNNGVNYVFLSNRVYPDAENKKLLSLSTRTEIQRVIYEAVKNIKDYSVIIN